MLVLQVLHNKTVDPDDAFLATMSADTRRNLIQRLKTHDYVYQPGDALQFVYSEPIEANEVHHPERIYRAMDDGLAAECGLRTMGVGDVVQIVRYDDDRSEFLVGCWALGLSGWDRIGTLASLNR